MGAHRNPPLVAGTATPFAVVRRVFVYGVALATALLVGSVLVISVGAAEEAATVSQNLDALTEFEMMKQWPGMYTESNDGQQGPAGGPNPVSVDALTEFEMMEQAPRLYTESIAKDPDLSEALATFEMMEQAPGLYTESITERENPAINASRRAWGGN